VVEYLNPGFDVGTYTQETELEVIRYLDSLKLALEEEIRRRREPNPNQQPPPPSQGRPPLVPPIAQILLLKKMQLDAMRRTQLLDAARANQDGDLDEFQQRMLDKLTLEQGRILEETARLTREIQGALQPPGEGDDPGREVDPGQPEERPERPKQQ
jgi:hypothetical protein